MQTKKFALLVGTLFLVGNLILPALVAAQEDQTGTLSIDDGTREIYYNGYGSGTIAGFDMVDSAGDTLTASSQQQDAFSAHSTDTTPWTEEEYLEAFIGVADNSNKTNPWKLQAQVGDTFTGNTNSIDLTDTNFKIATSGTAWGSTVTLTDNKPNSYQFTQFGGDGIHQTLYYYIDSSADYTFAQDDVVANLNVSDPLNDATTYSQGVSTATDMLEKLSDSTTTPGIFGVAVNYYHNLATGTPADTYTTDVTYTLIVAVGGDDLGGDDPFI